MSYVNTLVDEVYVINLDKDVERLKKINASLENAGIEYQRFSAIQGSQVSSHPNLTPLCSLFCTDGIKGCALSHHAVWKLAIENGYNSVLILEDDAIIPSDINERLREAKIKIPSDWDVIYVGCRFFCNDEHPVSKVGNRLLNSVPEEVDGDVKRVKGSAGAHATIYKTSFLQKIIDKKIHTHIDLQIQLWVRELNAKAYGLYPEIVSVNDVGEGSNLSEKFPPLLNTALNTITLGDNMPLGWALSENMMKVGVNINLLMIFLMSLVWFLPSWATLWLLGWLLLEGVVSQDIKNLLKFYLVLSIPLVIRYRRILLGNARFKR
jgi:GR25 family glycosyltransferase involved in LPS biosynthesis